MKLKAMILLVATCFTANLVAGDGEGRVYLGFSVTPDVTYRYLHGNFVPAGSSQSNVQGTADYGNKHTFPEFGVNANVKLGIKLTHWLAIEGGVGYSLVRYHYSSDLFYPSNVYNGNNYNLADSFKTSDKETYHYMTIPLGLRFTIGNKKVRAIICPGVDFDFLLKKQADYTYTFIDGTSVSNSQVQQYDNFKKFNLAPYLGIGFDGYVSEKSFIRVMPVAQIQAFKNINTPVTEYLWNLGLTVGFYFGL